jgi:hypothetical protein
VPIKYHHFHLHDKKTNKITVFKIYNEKDLLFLQARTADKKRLILDFNIGKLELEYDYDTDDE